MHAAYVQKPVLRYGVKMISIFISPVITSPTVVLMYKPLLSVALQSNSWRRPSWPKRSVELLVPRELLLNSHLKNLYDMAMTFCNIIYFTSLQVRILNSAEFGQHIPRKDFKNTLGEWKYCYQVVLMHNIIQLNFWFIYYWYMSQYMCMVQVRLLHKLRSPMCQSQQMGEWVWLGRHQTFLMESFNHMRCIYSY